MLTMIDNGTMELYLISFNRRRKRLELVQTKKENRLQLPEGIGVCFVLTKMLYINCIGFKLH